MITLGTAPEELTVQIPRTGRLSMALRATSGDWPVGTQIVLRFGVAPSAVTWTATITGPEARWDKARADCDAVLALRDKTAVLTCGPAVGEPVEWARGVHRAARPR